jgi:hypothetical protein
MPDGTLILASENIGNAAYGGGPRRELIIIFASKELLEREKERQQGKPNPYDQ